jgi:hypothetical protein
MGCVGADQQWLRSTGGRRGLVSCSGVRLTVGLCGLTIFGLIHGWCQLCALGFGEDLFGPKLGIFACGTKEFVV